MRPRAVGSSDSGAVHSGAGRLQAHYGLGIHEGPVDQETLVAVARQTAYKKQNFAHHPFSRGIVPSDRLTSFDVKPVPPTHLLCMTLV